MLASLGRRQIAGDGLDRSQCAEGGRAVALLTNPSSPTRVDQVAKVLRQPNQRCRIVLDEPEVRRDLDILMKAPVTPLWVGTWVVAQSLVR